MNTKFIFSLLMLAAPVLAQTVRIGNGDDGADLEGAHPLNSGPIVEAREGAVALLEKLNSAGIAGLGTLLPEVRNSALYLTQEDLAATLPEDQGAFHSNLKGQVYARTLAQPYAATRFFPAAEALSREQLIALHVHEALHRALPPAIRTNEALVSRLTLAMTTPGATFDSVREVAEANIPSAAPALAKEPAKIKHAEPSRAGYRMRQFMGKSAQLEVPVDRMHLIYSYLYPFGDDDAPFGLGIEASLIERGKRLRSGPLGLSARLRLWSQRGFEVDALGSAALNTLSAEELRNSALGRDVYTLGLAMRKDFDHVFVENSLNVNFKGRSSENLGAIQYTYYYGTVVNPGVRLGSKLGNSGFELGGFADIFLADYFRVRGGDFSFDTGRYRIISAGPQIGWRNLNWQLNLSGRFLLSATREAKFDTLGALLNEGVAQGGVEGSVAYQF